MSMMKKKKKIKIMKRMLSRIKRVGDMKSLEMHNASNAGGT